MMVLPLAMVSLTGCDEGIADLSCDAVEEEVVAISEGELIKITRPKLVSQTDQEIVCEGVGIYSRAENSRIRYRGYLDEDQEFMVEYMSE